MRLFGRNVRGLSKEPVSQVPVTNENPQSLSVDMMRAPRGARSLTVVPRRRKATRTPYRAHTAGGHIDGDHATPTLCQAEYGCSAAPHANCEGQGSARGALRRPQCEFILVDHTCMNSSKSLKPLVGRVGVRLQHTGWSWRVLVLVIYLLDITSRP